MKATIKTDQCIELLKEVLFSLSPFLFDARINDELKAILKDATNKGEAIRQYYLDKSGREIFTTDEDALKHVFDKELLLKRLTRSKALMCYVICPMMLVEGDFTNRKRALDFMRKNNLWTGEPYSDIVLNALQIGAITEKDLEHEFMEMCPDIDSIPKYLQVTRVKFKDVLSRIPDKDYYSFDNLLFNQNDNEYSGRVQPLVEMGVITHKEAEDILVSVSMIIRDINWAVNKIAEMYKELEKMALPSTNGQEATKNIPVELQTEEARELLGKAVKVGLCTEDYTWKKGMQLAACFAKEMSDRMNLGKGQNQEGVKRVSWKPFEVLFDFKSGSLRGHLNDIQKTGINPSNIDLVENIFK